MNQELIRALTALTECLGTIAGAVETLRDDLRGVTLALSETARSEEVAEIARETVEPVGVENGTVAVVAAGAARDAPATTTTTTAPPEPPRPVLPLPELTLGRSRPADSEARVELPASVARTMTTDAALPAVESRCNLKAEGLRWAAQRRQLIDDGADFRVEIAPRDRELFERARAVDCYLWMNTPEFVLPRELSLLGDVAGCFEMVARAVSLAQEMIPDLDVNREFYEPALDLLAEAQSALRVAIERIEGPSDPDQFRVYDWLRGVASREHIYIRRHMRLDDPADPSQRAGVEARIEALETRFMGVRQRSKKKKSRLGKLRYHARLLAEGNGGEHDWKKVIEAVDEMSAEGVPASSVDLREVLLPILDHLPEHETFSTAFSLVLREIDRYLATRPPSPAEVVEEAPSPVVAEATQLLAGKSVVLIGGSRRPEAHEALKAAFGLEELYWVETREHESIDKFEPYVAKPEVALILLAIRWSSHSFGEVKRFCDRYGKPMVRLPGGYSPNQVAAQVLAQVSSQLGDRAE